MRWPTTGRVALLALIAGTVSYLHMHQLVELHGQPGWVAALTRPGGFSGGARNLWTSRGWEAVALAGAM